MFSQRRPTFPFDAALINRLRVLIFGRLALILVIVLAGWLWIYSDAQYSLSSVPNGLILLVAASVLLTAIYLLWLRFVRTLLWQIRAQFLFDTLLITWLVWGTGDVISPYITLYIFLISIAGFFLGRSDAYIITACCIVCFTALSLLTLQALEHPGFGEVEPSRAAQIIAFNDAAFLLVGLLAARLADRRKIGEELKQAEANFANLSVLHERILESINSGLITTDLTGNIYAFNRAAEEISGLKAEDVISKKVFAVFGDEIRQPIEMCLTGIETPECSPPNFDAQLHAPIDEDGTFRDVTVECSVSPLIGRSGGVTGLIVAFQDKTELHAMERTLRLSDQMAAVGRMAAGLAHEIRNPLGSMSSALQFLSEKAKPDAEDAALMAVVLRESDRLNRIIADFLTYARPQPAGETKRGSEHTDLGEAVEDCLVLLKHDPAVRDTHIFEYEPPARAAVIRAAGTQIKQILWNLFQNSVQAMPDGGRLTVSLSEQGPKQVRIVVADTGDGISPESLERIFEPFHSGADGTGLGLSIVHRIVTEHGGRIDVESEEGTGTRITVDLPK